MCVCVGTTREDEVDGRTVIGLEYEAYELMAQSEFTKLCADIRERWPTVTHICVHHRLGCDANANCYLLMLTANANCGTAAG